MADLPGCGLYRRSRQLDRGLETSDHGAGPPRRRRCPRKGSGPGRRHRAARPPPAGGAGAGAPASSDGPRTSTPAAAAALRQLADQARRLDAGEHQPRHPAGRGVAQLLPLRPLRLVERLAGALGDRRQRAVIRIEGLEPEAPPGATLSARCQASWNVRSAARKSGTWSVASASARAARPTGASAQSRRAMDVPTTSRTTPPRNGLADGRCPRRAQRGVVAGDARAGERGAGFHLQPLGAPAERLEPASPAAATLARRRLASRRTAGRPRGGRAGDT